MSRPLRVLIMYERQSWHGEADILAGYERAFRAQGIDVFGFDRTWLLALLSSHGPGFLKALEEFIRGKRIDLAMSCNLNGCFVFEDGDERRNFFDLIGVPHAVSFNDALPTYLGEPTSFRSRVFGTLLASPGAAFGTIRPEDAATLRAMGKPAVFAPPAFDDRLRSRSRVNRDFDLVFVGSIGGMDSPRYAALADLSRQGLHLFGPRLVPEVGASRLGRLYRGSLKAAADLYRVYRRARICIDLNSEPGLIPGRLFMAMGNGALVMAPRKEVVTELFEPDRDFVAFDDPRELVALASYYLRNEREARRIAESGRRAVRAGHTYRNRARLLIEFLDRSGLLRRPTSHPERSPKGSRPAPSPIPGFRRQRSEGVVGWAT